MDSISQAALGSAVVLATMGRHTAAWKAALWGAVAGTLPDLDALIDHGDALLGDVAPPADDHPGVELHPCAEQGLGVLVAQADETWLVGFADQTDLRVEY